LAFRAEDVAERPLFRKIDGACNTPTP
jgi:hypothetical protein